MDQNKDSSHVKEEARLLRKKFTRMQNSRDALKSKNQDKAKIIKAQQDREQELKENRDHWKSKCKEQELKNEELRKVLKQLSRKLAISDEELLQVLHECTELKKNSLRRPGKSTPS